MFTSGIRLALASLAVVLCAAAQQAPGATTLANIRMRDPCILPDQKSRTYYLVGAANRSVRVYSSRDLIHWTGPEMVFQAGEGFWGNIPIDAIWAPEMHSYRGKYYLFLTFSTSHKLAEQWRNWLPRVRRGSEVLVAESPHGFFKPFQNHAILPADMMTLDGTLWVEDAVPYMVFCHEWVQITNGTIEFIRLKDDLSEIVGAPAVLFRGEEAPWSQMSKRHGSHVTDGPYLFQSKSGKLFMIWSSIGKQGYTTGLAISDSGKLAGPWRQQAEPLYADDGGHGMLFRTFEGNLMLVLHAPNSKNEQPHLFLMEDTGETLRIKSEFPGQHP